MEGEEVLEIIDWNEVHSVFVVDDTYENLNAPMWFHFSSSANYELSVDNVRDDRNWFCNPDCSHPENADDYSKPTRNSKMKFLRSATISGALRLKDRTRGDSKLSKCESSNWQTLKTKGSVAGHKICIGDAENKNPNLPEPTVDTKNKVLELDPEKKQNLSENSCSNSSKERLKSRFSARNLVAGKIILDQISEFCSKLVKMHYKKDSTKNVKALVLSTDNMKERQPLLEILKTQK